MMEATTSFRDQDDHDRAVIEAALFVSPVPLTLRSLGTLLGGVSQPYVRRLLQELGASLADAPDRGVELVLEPTKAMLKVKRAFVDLVAHLAPQQDISRPILRTLAVIAYNQPMTQADLVKTRGNKAYAHVHELVERALIRSEPHGRTMLLHVTREFLQYFGLTRPEEFHFHVAGTEDAEGAELAADAPTVPDAPEDEAPEDDPEHNEATGDTT